MSSGGQYLAFSDVAIVDAVRTPWVDLGGALGHISPIDLGIKVGREVLARAATQPGQVDSVLTGSMAQASFDAYLLPRHVGLYSGVAQSVPALGVQRICATGLELLRQAAQHVSEGGQMFANRLQKNLKLMGKWVRREGIDCYRVYDADMPEYSLAIDLYHDWVHVQEYAAPKSIDPEKASARLFDALAAIPQALNIDKNRVVIKRRERQSGTKQYERQSAQGQFLEVSEGGVKLLVNLTDYLDTGLFLDHRPMRMRIQREASGKRFLNLFAYTATASVHAAKGGARSTTSVDLSRTYLDWARRNLSLNGFSDKNRLEQGDVMAWLQANRDEYDLIFIDPPTFSNSKRMEGIFDVQRDQVELIDLAMARLAPGGVLYFSNNFRKFVLDENLSQRYAVEDITAQTIDQDFARNGKIHRAWKIMARA
ncbi:Ribosomal RNA large subunit methyltransferase K/L [Pseudomonas amygdali pv. tabaci]|uniref:Ribosomal RNA large subunit methyltransferase K/L n=1 Tax=Pseudomonas amygdali pv. tabaci TaxID=322 RepID=A0A3M6I468_PSEAJ|nr:Ribosomal RNA large subunit methyltransferase K/L [Pseudomonas amygdali pv. tabaci]